jgi:pimeloyl-ACP methyl ester carboxylesterase
MVSVAAVTRGNKGTRGRVPGGVEVTTFGLIHGAWHGAWCWDLLRPELERRGHDSIAADLPCDDPTAGVERYVETALATFDGVVGDLVVVGHSLGGLTAPFVAARTAARRLVLIAALLPEPGRTLLDQVPDNPDMFVPEMDGKWRTNDDGTTEWSAEWATRAFYDDCPPERAAWACARLRRQGAPPYVEVTPLQMWPDVPTSYIATTKDKIIGSGWQRRVAKARLGIEAIDIRTAHSPFLSTPAAVADILGELAVTT